MMRREDMGTFPLSRFQWDTRNVPVSSSGTRETSETTEKVTVFKLIISRK